MSDYVQTHCQYSTFRTEETWTILSDIEQGIKQKVESIGIPLKDWDIEIYRGVLTGYNDAFIISSEKREEILDNCRSQDERQRTEEIIRPILRGRDIKRYGYNWAGLYLIWIPWHFPLHLDSSIQGVSEKAEIAFKLQYPSVYQHLLQYKDKLSARNKAETGIRYEWYALQRWGANYWDEFSKPKIVWIELSDESKFALCNDLIPLNTVFFLTGENLHHILGLLNSRLIHWYFTHCLGTSSGAGTNRWLKYTIENLPLVSYVTDELSALIRQRLSNSSCVKQLELQIDQYICELYGLSQEETNFILTCRE